MKLLQMAIVLIQTELDAAKVGGAAPEIIAHLAAALAALIAAHGQAVTFAELESLRVKPSW